MESFPRTNSSGNLRTKYVYILLGWSVLIGASLAWNIRHETHETLSKALSAAQSHINKDLAFRKWGALHGGLYVTPTASAPPNLFLNHPERDVVTTDGKALTLLNAAYALRLVQEFADKDSPVRTRLTSLKPINPYNAADAWEKKALQRFETGTKSVSEVDLSSGQPHLRLMVPFIVEQGCLKCHGSEEYKLGDVRGGISADVSLQLYQAEERAAIVDQIGTHGLIWLLGFLGTGSFYRRERDLDAARKLADAQVFERDALFRNYFELSPVGMCVTSIDHKWLRVNRSLCDMLGYSENKLTLMTWAELTHPDDLHFDLDQFKKLVGGAIESYDLDKRFIHKSGNVVYTHLTVSCQRKTDGTVDYVIASLDDITQRKQMEDALKESEERWKLALDGAGDGVWDVNVQTGQAQYSRRWNEMLGYSESDVMPDHQEFLDRIHPEDVERVAACMQDYVEGKTATYAAEFRLRCKDGSYRWILSRGMGLSRQADGKPLRMIGTHSDITERKQMEEDVRQLAFFDPLTQLPNRRLLDDRLTRAMAASKRSRLHCALMFLDMDNFKPLNDKYGHEVGDLLLIEVAKRLIASVREIDIVARFGGDEFVVVLSELDVSRARSAEQARAVAEKIGISLSSPYLLNASKHNGVIKHECSVSIGVVVFFDHEMAQSDVMKWADATMYRAKAAGRNLILFHEANVQA